MGHGDMIKGAGYCITPDCIAFQNATFFMGKDDHFICIQCNNIGYLERNATWFDGYGLTREARVHFKFDFANKTYKNTAIVSIAELDPVENTRVIHMNHPFILTEKTALNAAEQALANLATGHTGITIDLSADDKVFKDAIAKLAASLQASEILRADLGRDFVPLGGKS